VDCPRCRHANRAGQKLCGECGSRLAMAGAPAGLGAGMRSNPGVSATFFKALANAGVNIEMISTSEIRISVITRDDLLDEAVRAVHTAFGLDSSEGEAVVYGGTGR